MNILYLQHVPFEGLGSIERWALENGHSLSRVRLFAGDPFPSLERFQWLIVMGGPMSIYDEKDHVWLKAEKWFVRQVIEAGKPVLGICLGAQLIADVLGAKVTKGKHKEIGWFPVRLDEAFAQTRLGQALPAEMNVFHWHGETFELPAGAHLIGSSEVCENQGFIYGDRVIGLQFHLEMTATGAQELISCSLDELVDAPYIQTADEMLADESRFADTNRLMRTILEHLEATSGTAG